MNRLSPYIEHYLQCTATGRDPDPDAKRHEKMALWDEIIGVHVGGMVALLKISQNAEDALRAMARENNLKPIESIAEPRVKGQGKQEIKQTQAERRIKP